MYTKDEIDDLRFCVEIRISVLQDRIKNSEIGDEIDREEAGTQVKRLEKLANKLLYTTP